MAKEWQSYEEVARYLLDKFAETFDLGHAEDKQIVPGLSGTDWEIDAKGVVEGGEGFLVVEMQAVYDLKDRPGGDGRARIPN